MKILIIGCGYVGMAAAMQLRSDGHSISVTTTSPSRVEELQKIAANVWVITGADAQQLTQACEGQDAVILSVAAKNRESYRTTYLETARTLLSVLPQTSVKQLIYTSSASVYGDQPDVMVTEDTIPNPATPHSSILFETETTLQLLENKGVNVCIFRLGQIIGPGREVSRMLKHRIGMPFPGDGSQIANLSPVDDIVNGIVFALDHRLSGVYNLCSDFHPTRQDLYAQLCEIHNLPPVKWDPTQTSLHGGKRMLSCNKLKTKGFTFVPIAVDVSL